jgi:parvulin-like peptidyl-prolyl isomerase
MLPYLRTPPFKMFIFLFYISCSEPEVSSEQNIVELEEVYPTDNAFRAKGRHILIAYEKSWRAAPEIRRTKQDALERAELVRSKVLQGISFASLAKKYSDDPSKHQQGSVGVVERGEFVPEFEQTLFNLQINEVSTVLETGFGYHIVQRLPLEELKLIHILVQWSGIENSLATRSQKEALSIVTNIHTEIKNGANPELMAKQYSEAPFGSRGGMLGWFERDSLHKNYADIVFDLHIGDCSTPIESQHGYHLFCRVQ